ncbi:MAG: hypothetical protein ACERLM_15705 [Acidimicrobiales bacterium]
MERGYEICIRGRLDAVLMSELGDLEPETAGTTNATTLLTITTDDQATLHATMARIRDLGLVVEWVAKGSEHAGDTSPPTVQAHD